MDVFVCMGAKKIIRNERNQPGHTIAEPKRMKHFTICFHKKKYKCRHWRKIESKKWDRRRDGEWVRERIRSSSFYFFTLLALFSFFIFLWHLANVCATNERNVDFSRKLARESTMMKLQNAEKDVDDEFSGTKLLSIVGICLEILLSLTTNYSNAHSKLRIFLNKPLNLSATPSWDVTSHQT